MIPKGLCKLFCVEFTATEWLRAICCGPVGPGPLRGIRHAFAVSADSGLRIYGPKDRWTVVGG
jgi:hypothetical protein